MQVFLVAVCALAVCGSVGVRGERALLAGPRSELGVSSGYGGAYVGYGDYGRYGGSFASDYAPAYPPGYSSYGSYAVAPGVSVDEVVNVDEEVDVPPVEKVRKVAKLRKVVKVRKLSSDPKVVKVKKVVAAPRYSAGYIGYGSGVSSAHSSFPDHPDRSSYPGYASGYAGGWWMLQM